MFINQKAGQAAEFAADERPGVADVAETFIRLMRSFTRMRSQFLAAANHDVEWASHILISHLAAGGPMRSSALADAVQSDPSTVSRQVATLVKDGFVERHADPVDGRASLLAVTEKGRLLYQDHVDIRIAHYGRMLADWSPEDCATFSTLLARFTDDFEKSKSEWMPPTRVDTEPRRDAAAAEMENR